MTVRHAKAGSVHRFCGNMYIVTGVARSQAFSSLSLAIGCPSKGVLEIADVGERLIALHVGRAAALLLCLLTEIQSFYKFDGPARIDDRLATIWLAMLQTYEVKELYASRYRALLRGPQT